MLLQWYLIMLLFLVCWYAHFLLQGSRTCIITFCALMDTLFGICCESTELNLEPIEGEEEEHNWIFSAAQLGDDEVAGEDPDWNLSQNPTGRLVILMGIRPCMLSA